MKKLLAIAAAAAMLLNSSSFVFASEGTKGESANVLKREMTTKATTGSEYEKDFEDYTDEEIDRLLKAEREARKKELGITKKVTQEMYAAFFGRNNSDINTEQDVLLADAAFKKMGYITEPFTNPTKQDIAMRYSNTDILLFAGHGEYDHVRIPDPSGKVEGSGVHMGSGYKDVRGDRLVGLATKGMKQCRFVMFAACLTASNGNNNIANKAVQLGAESSIGWKQKVESLGLHTWEADFFGFLERGSSLFDAREYTNKLFDEVLPDNVTDNELYGNKNIVLSKNRSARIEDPFTRAKLPRGVDYKANNFEVVTEYFDKTVEGFDKDTCKIVLVNEPYQEPDNYELKYKLYYKGYKTRYGIYAIMNPKDGLKYSSSINKFDMEKADSLSIPDSSEITEDQIKTAKEKAVENYGEYAVLEQDVTLVFNRDYKRVIEVNTVYVNKDENGKAVEGETGFVKIYLYFVDEGYGEEFDGTNY